MTSNRLPVLAAELRNDQICIRQDAERTAARVLDAGRKLIEAKGLVAHGGWRAWLAEIGMPERTASAYMRLASSGLKSATVADLGIRAALEAIARPPSRTDMPRPAKGQALLVEAGRQHLGFAEHMAVVRPVGGGDRFHMRALWHPPEPGLGCAQWSKLPVIYGEPLRLTLVLAIGTEDWTAARLVGVADPIAAFVWDSVGEMRS